MPRHLPDEERDALLTALMELRAQPNVSFVTTYPDSIRVMLVRSAEKARGGEARPWLMFEVPGLDCIAASLATALAHALAQSPFDADPHAFSDRRGTLTATFTFTQFTGE